MTAKGGHLLVIGEETALRWILAEQRMAFPRHRAKEALGLRRGDTLLLYVTRGAFHNPTRDRGRVIGEAAVAARPESFSNPISVAGREFDLGCPLRIKVLCPRDSGVELAPLVDALDAFPKKHAWSATMRRTLVPLPANDVALLRRLLRARATKTVEAAATYDRPRKSGGATPEEPRR
jgi:hypothetical protein